MAAEDTLGTPEVKRSRASGALASLWQWAWSSGEMPSLCRRYSGLAKGLQRQENRARRGIPHGKSIAGAASDLR